MKPIIVTDRCLLLHGDSAQLGDVLSENSIDAIVTDPPAGIGFMQRGWDSDKGGRDNWIAWLADLLRSSFAALKPGGHALVWAIPRTSHWTAMALEHTGFEIRDVHHHIFGTGFPKSLTSKSANIPTWSGTALKPAVEHWILARKSLDGTVAANFVKYRTGVLNIDGCRIAYDESGPPPAVYSGAKGATAASVTVYGASEKYTSNVSDHGRWPAHLSLDEYAAGALDEQSEAKGSSRFFYCAKGSRKEKDAGLDHLAPTLGGEATGRAEGSAGTANPRAGAGRTGGARNFHPTVKSVELMRWLVRLITPPGGTVLDMFAGSGTTGVAALAESMSFIGVEQSEEYLPIVAGRLRHALAEYVGNGERDVA